ncbi:hypothetical protein NDU88_003890 [Pleurodeles waltl]|uniref:Uncharacterized protein n=1 Tax=Pleurodeles waltl TaxID=8319 RepID=A0AAV7RGH9_PLEWA|nr:hypothetical protein NDU88_003890 [Pleurodeles waltl]
MTPYLSVASYLITRLRTVFRSCGGDDDSPSCQGNGDAGNQLGNPDVQVPEHSEKDDGLGARGEEEEKNADNEEERNEETEDGSRNGNSEVPRKINGQPWAGKRAGTHELRHVPGGTWLTKKPPDDLSIMRAYRIPAQMSLNAKLPSTVIVSFVVYRIKELILAKAIQKK